jgi:hypothetical protein
MRRESPPPEVTLVGGLLATVGPRCPERGTMTTEREMKNKALEAIPDLLEVLMKQVKEEQDLGAARLIAEMAGLARTGTGRPPSKRQERPEPTAEELRDRSKFADEVLRKHESNVRGGGIDPAA